VNAVEAERFRHIQRDVGNGFAITFKDLVWLVRLVEKFEKPSTIDANAVLLAEGIESINTIRKRRLELEAAKKPVTKKRKK
jgi:hypothetical protein